MWDVKRLAAFPTALHAALRMLAELQCVCRYAMRTAAATTWQYCSACSVFEYTTAAYSSGYILFTNSL